MKFVWSQSPGHYAQAMLAKDNQIRSNMGTVGNSIATEGTSRMQASAAWTDRTGQARRQLSATATVSGDTLAIVFKHGVSYGIYLERKPQYAVVLPTMRAMLADIHDRFRGILR